MCRRIAGWVLAVGLAVAPLMARGQVVPAGTEFQVNTYTSQSQIFPEVCSDLDGNFVVVWTSYGDSDGYRTGIFGQRFASGGDELGTEFQINTYTTGPQTVPRVCCDAAGDFVVVWHSFEDGDSVGVFGQRFASSGAFQGTEFQVNTYTTSIQANPDVCCGAVGDFVVAWRSASQDGNADGIFGQRFASSGNFEGTEFQVNTYTPGSQESAGVCCDAAANFVVVWSSLSQDGSVEGVFGQRFASGGAPRGSEFQVNTYTLGGQRSPAICCDEAGDFNIVWDGTGQDGSGDGIFGQRFNSSGTRRGEEFAVNTYTAGNQLAPSICCGPNRGFVVAWAGSYQDGGGLEGYAVLARRFSPVGPASSEILVNTYTSGEQFLPAVACNKEGEFVVVWTSLVQDGFGAGIFGQRFELLGVVPTPVLSFAALALSAFALVGAGVARLRRRGR